MTTKVRRGPENLSGGLVRCSQKALEFMQVKQRTGVAVIETAIDGAGPLVGQVRQQ